MCTEFDTWINNVLEKSSPIAPKDPLERELAELLVDIVWEYKNRANGATGYALASAYDLLVACEYFASLSHSGWLYCPEDTPRLFFHYTNCCPRHVLSNNFYFHPSMKPESGRIGTATSRLLLLFFETILKKANRPERILKGSEPVDAIIVNDEEQRILFAEIKASPLLTPPISTLAQRLTVEVEGETTDRGHDSVDNTGLFGAPLELLIPSKGNQGWRDSYHLLGSRNNREDKAWGYRGIIQLLKKDANFFPAWFSFWEEALKAYHPKKFAPIFWLTNACGTPTPTPSNWPERRRGSGFESISDTKTSVGMDRTDDIKKGIYQVLKIGSVGKPNTEFWDFKVALMSNIHAARHFNDYLASLKDTVWTLDSTGKAKKVADLPDDQDVFNLFDGIITLTFSLSRDDWINEIISEMER